MTHVSRTSLYATAAISAALAFGPTPVLAQAAAPTITLPPTVEAPAAQPAPAPAPQPAPTIVLPPSVTQTAPEPAAEEAAPAPSPAAEAAAAPAEEARSAPAERESSVAEAAPAAEPAPAPQAAVAPPADAAPEAGADVPPPVVPAAAPNEVPAPAEAGRASVPSEIDVPDGIIAASVLGVIGLGIAGFIATRRRRSDGELVESDYEPDPEFVAEAPITAIPDELAVHAPERAAEPAAPQPAMAAAQAGFAMPQGPVPTGEARQRLIDDMVAAQPDEANPFTSCKARRKRARIILQAREQRLREQATEPFDWRTYRSSATTPANPPMVDA